MLAKAILQYSFNELGENQGGVHGEFGSIENYNEDELYNHFEQHIDDRIVEIFNALNTGIYVNGNILPYDFENFRKWILGLPEDIRIKIDASSIINMDLSEFLAENGTRKTAEKLMDLRVLNVMGLSYHDLPDSNELWDIVEEIETELMEENFSIDKIKDILKEITPEFIEELCW